MLTTIDHGSYFTNLPREYYLSEDIFETELAKVLRRQWLLVGHTSSVRKPGDYFEKQVGPESMIIVRDNDNKVRAFFNVCRHRGSRILDEGACGHAKGFVCPYHKWTYDTQGKLRSVPSLSDGTQFNFADWPLKDAHCQTFQGWIFVWLGEEQPPLLDDVLGPMRDAAALEAIGSERLKLAHRETYVVKANWKSMLENNMECYHCGLGGHPSLAISCDYRAMSTDKATGAHFPLREGMDTFSMTGERVCKIPLGNDQGAGFSTGFLLTPNFCGPVFFVDHAVSLELTPLSREETQLVCEWYVHEDAVEGVDYDVEALIKVFHVTNLEDGDLAERNYRGIKSARFQPGPHLDHRESGVKLALTQYLQMMAA
jgi:Rieske 2Fe-2S family protein